LLLFGPSYRDFVDRDVAGRVTMGRESARVVSADVYDAPVR
jgi:hypothetical protein